MEPLAPPQDDRLVVTPRFTFVGAALCLDFANTVSNYHLTPAPEPFRAYPILVAWAHQAALLDEPDARRLLDEAGRRPRDAAAVVERAIRLRGAIFAVVSAARSGQPAPPDALRTLDAEVATALGHLRLRPRDDTPAYTLDWEDAPAALDRVLWPVARSAADLLADPDRLARVRECGGHDCTWLFVDTSKNHSRQWCTMQDCGNRAKARRFYERRKARSR